MYVTYTLCSLHEVCKMDVLLVGCVRLSVHPSVHFI